MLKQHVPALMLTALVLAAGLASFLRPDPASDPVERTRYWQPVPVAADEVAGFATLVEPGVRRPQQAAPTRSVLDGFEVIGSIETDGRNIILISGQGQVVSLEVGDQIAGYTLTALNDGQARFESEAGAVTLQLPF